MNIRVTPPIPEDTGVEGLSPSPLANQDCYPKTFGLISGKFDALVDKYGYTSDYEEAIQCPCLQDKDSSPLSSCKNCGGIGWVFVNKKTVNIMVQRITENELLIEDGGEESGYARVTARSDLHMAVMDRITVHPLSGIFQEVHFLGPQQNSSTSINNQVLFKYPVRHVMQAYAYSSDNTPLIPLKPTDYSINGQIVVFSQSLKNKKVVVKYEHPLVYHIRELFREQVAAPQKDCAEGELVKRLPTHAKALRAHNVPDIMNARGVPVFTQPAFVPQEDYKLKTNQLINGRF